jgi:hypothetical protein
MDEIEEFSEERNKAWCVHCGSPLASRKTSRDHVPTKTLLHPPYPPNLPIVMVCHRCNQSFRTDEQYLVAFLSAVLAGTTDPATQANPNAARILLHNTELRTAIDASKREDQTSGGERKIVWDADLTRVSPVVVKNARGHAFYEYGEPMLNEPDSVLILPVSLMSATERRDFEEVPSDGVWPEVGSRMMTRVLTGQDLDGPWVVVQEGCYRFAITQADGGLFVRSVISEYLATQVSWL